MSRTRVLKKAVRRVSIRATKWKKPIYYYKKA